jgi:hypothetical protein
MISSLGCTSSFSFSFEPVLVVRPRQACDQTGRGDERRAKAQGADPQAERHGQVGLAHARWPEQQHVVGIGRWSWPGGNVNETTMLKRTVDAIQPQQPYVLHVYSYTSSLASIDTEPLKPEIQSSHPDNLIAFAHLFVLKSFPCNETDSRSLLTCGEAEDGLY